MEFTCETTTKIFSAELVSDPFPDRGSLIHHLAICPLQSAEDYLSRQHDHC